MIDKVLLQLMVFAVLLGVTSTALLAQGPGVDIYSVTPLLQEAESGHIVTFSFRVHNLTEQEQEFEEWYDLPDGWHAIVPPGRFVLEPGEELARQVAVQVPRGARAGVYEIMYGVRSERDDAISDSETVDVRVLPVEALELLFVDAPERVMAGKDYEIRARMINRGNVTLSVELSVSEREGFPARVIPQEVERLAPGSSVLVRIEGGTDGDLDRPRTHRVRLTAEALPANDRMRDEMVSETLSIGIDVLPRISELEPMRHTYPVELRTDFLFDDGDTGVQAVLRGSGYLDEEGKRHLDFFLRAPDERDVGVYGRREQFGATYSEPDFTVQAGDRRYELSPLTTTRFARGGGIHYHPEGVGFEAGTFYAQDAWRRRKRRDVGAYAGVTPHEAASLRLNVLRRTVDASGALPSARDSVYSLLGDFELFAGDSLELEYGYSESNRDSGVRDHAYSASYRGALFDDVRYSLRHRHYGPDYYGRSRDSEYSSGTVTFPVYGTLRGNLTCTLWDRNLDRDDERGTAPRSQRYRAGVSWRLADAYRMSLGVEEFRREDRNPDPDPEFDYREQAALAALSRSFGWGSVRLDARRGRMDDRLVDERDRAWSFGSTATYRPHRRLRLSAFGNYGERYDVDPSNRIIRTTRRYGGRVRWDVRNDLHVNADVSRYEYEERRGSARYSAGANYTLPNGHAIRAGVRHSERRGREDRTSGYVGYTVPFDVPLRRKQSVGAVEGRVLVVEDNGRRVRVMRDVILFADGASAVTDRDGRFIFPALEPGMHELKVDVQSVGPGYVPLDEMPIRVEVEGGRTKEVRIEMARSGSMAGRVVLAVNDGQDGDGEPSEGINLQGDGSNNNSNLWNNNNNFHNNNILGDGNNNNNLQGDGRGDGAEGGLSGILVEMRRDGELQRTLTGRRGEFLFERLQPGEWTLKVYDDRLPAYHVIEAPERNVQVEPGERGEVIVKVRLRERAVQIIDEGVIDPEEE